MNHSIYKTAKHFIKKDLKYDINFKTVSAYLQNIGFAIVPYTRDKDNEILVKYNLLEFSKTVRGFTVFRKDFKAVFIDSSIASEEKLCVLLHETAHIILNHIDKKDLKDERTLEMEADAFAYAVLNYKRNYKPLYFAICLVLASVISATAGYNLHSDDTPPPEQYSVPISNSITPTTEQTETQAPVINENNTEFVYVTKSGTRYHKANCQYVRNNNTATAIKADEADKRYTPCKVCNPN